MENVGELVSKICQSIPEPERAAVQSVIRGQLALDEEQQKAVDGRHAYMWCDLLAWEDVVGAAAGLLTGGGPAAVGITALLVVMAKHRSLRVQLTRGQADTLRLVKAGNNTLDGLIVATRLTAAEGKVKGVLEELMAMCDPSGRPLLEFRASDQTYHTRF